MACFLNYHWQALGQQHAPSQFNHTEIIQSQEIGSVHNQPLKDLQQTTKFYKTEPDKLTSPFP